MSFLQFALMRLLMKLSAIVDSMSLEEYYVDIYLLCLIFYVPTLYSLM